MQLIKLLFSPAVFALGFLWPLVTQVILAAELMADGWQVWLVSALVVLPFVIMAQLRGSWIWLK